MICEYVKHIRCNIDSKSYYLFKIMCLADFFKNDDIFIAYGPEKYSHDDFDLDSDGRLI